MDCRIKSGNDYWTVMAGLVPAIHGFTAEKKDVEGRA
jgi:hypothetical protein